MDLRLIDIGSVMELRDRIIDLTKLNFSVYDQKGRLLVSSLTEDPLSLIGRDGYTDFIKTCIDKAVLRKGVSLFKGPLNQYQCFIPIQIGADVLVFAGNSFYTSAKDRDVFFFSKGPAHGLSAEEMRSLAGRVAVRDLKDVSEVCGNAHRLFILFLKDNYEKNLNRERYRKVRTLMDLFSDIDQHTITKEGVFDLLCDAIIFLFAGDTVSLLREAGDTFAPVLTAGRVREAVETVPLQRNSFLVTDIIRNRKPLACSETMELLRLGYPEEVTSVQAFPLFKRDHVMGLLSVFNSHLSEDDAESISRLCRFSEFLLEYVQGRESYARYAKDREALELASARLPMVGEAETLYESVVELASRHVDAEKASLMLLDEETGELLIRATRGMNKWIAGSIRVRVGEGIAGKVFQEGTPRGAARGQEELPGKKRPNYRTSSFVSVPLRIGEETIGVLNFADKRGGEPFTKADGDFLIAFAAYVSIAIRGTQCYLMSEQMRTLSITDSLTGLFNRRYFDNRLFEELQRATRYETVFALAIFDIDDFKLFNDTEGHPAGDEVLKTIANIARESLRSIDIIARFGGEEFSIIMPQTDKDKALLVAERVRTNIRDFVPMNWKTFPQDKITVSVGLATFPADGTDAKALIRSADKALYRAKVNGKNRTVVSGVADAPASKGRPKGPDRLAKGSD
ncbi:MAG: sensor domain-containing diguanylate cyclase [Nitrospirae bacterium]|nr:sensor domain-containing diguanylate cyclase [Nitrospirota bacterium]